MPEASFREGTNRIDIYAVSGSSGALRLLRLGGTPARADTHVMAGSVLTGNAAEPEQP